MGGGGIPKRGGAVRDGNRPGSGGGGRDSSAAGGRGDRVGVGLWGGLDGSDDGNIGPSNTCPSFVVSEAVVEDGCAVYLSAVFESDFDRGASDLELGLASQTLIEESEDVPLADCSAVPSLSVAPVSRLIRVASARFAGRLRERVCGVARNGRRGLGLGSHGYQIPLACDRAPVLVFCCGRHRPWVPRAY